MGSAQNTFNTVYARTHTAPAKKYSYGETLVHLVQPRPGMLVTDVGCGDGFFSRQFAAHGATVLGIDNSSEQIAAAQKIADPQLTFERADMFTFPYITTDVVCAPFVANYVRELEAIIGLFTRWNDALVPGGRLVLLLDMPKQPVHDMRKFGNCKRVQNDLLFEGAPMQVELYDAKGHVQLLNSFYYTPDGIAAAVSHGGFQDFREHEPLIAPAGIERFGEQFWERYKKGVDVAYFTAEKAR